METLMVSKVPETGFIELLGLNVQCIFFYFFPIIAWAEWF